MCPVLVTANAMELALVVASQGPRAKDGEGKLTSQFVDLIQLKQPSGSEMNATPMRHAKGFPQAARSAGVVRVLRMQVLTGLSCPICTTDPRLAAKRLPVESG
jgi:hypothetical protein